MKKYFKAAAPLLSALLLLCACGGKQAPPQAYTLEENSLPSLTELLALEDVEFEQTTGEEGAVTYVYSKLASGGETAQSYAQALEEEYDCTLATDAETPGAPDFSQGSGQVLAAQKLEESEQVFLLTIQWEEERCSVTPSLADESAMPQQKDESITLDEAAGFLENTAPSALGLPGESMDEYLVYPQEGTVFLDKRLCVLLNVYRASDHQFQQSYLLTVPDKEVYALDRATGEAKLLG